MGSAWNAVQQNIVRIEHQAPAAPEASPAKIGFIDGVFDPLRAAEVDAEISVRSHHIFFLEQAAHRQTLEVLRATTKSLSEITAERDEARAELTRVCAAYEKADTRSEGLLAEVNKLAQTAEHERVKAAEAESAKVKLRLELREVDVLRREAVLGQTEVKAELASARADREALAEGVRLLREQATLIGHDGGAAIRDEVRAWERKHGHLTEVKP
jgi:chromosome segregation ATPase